ncbi:MAG: hypothetical protein NTU94_11805 [Planctomycetota bacterium]|nr:hypothetical protein [Planctomycetota bacterium]
MSRKHAGAGRRGLVLALAAVALVLSAGYAGAGPTASLYDANSVALFDPLSPAGLYSWEVDGRQYISQQWFWWRTGASGPEKPVDAATLDVPTGMPRLSDANGDGVNDMLFCRYLDKGGTFKIELTFLLIGGQMGSGTSDMAETIKICNTSALPIDFHFFQYVDFNLSASDTVWFPNANTVRQIGSGTQVGAPLGGPRPFFVRVDDPTCSAYPGRCATAGLVRPCYLVRRLPAMATAPSAIRPSVAGSGTAPLSGSPIPEP